MIAALLGRKSVRPIPRRRSAREPYGDNPARLGESAASDPGGASVRYRRFAAAARFRRAGRAEGLSTHTHQRICEPPEVPPEERGHPQETIGKGCFRARGWI